MKGYASCPHCREAVPYEVDHLLEGTDRKALDAEIKRQAAAHRIYCSGWYAEREMTA